MSRTRNRRYDYETPTPDPYPEAVRVRQYAGIACVILGEQVEADDDTEWSGCKNTTGQWVAHMIGDDRLFLVEASDIQTLAREEYCGECGQIGCACDGWPRDDE